LENIKIDASENSPEVELDFGANKFSFSGMSYMEDVGEFYDPFLPQLKSYLSELKEAIIQVDFKFSYFNSTSSRVVFGIFESLDQTAEQGNDVTINWSFDDEDIGEEGEMLGEDLEHAKVVLIEVE